MAGMRFGLLFPCGGPAFSGGVYAGKRFGTTRTSQFFCLESPSSFVFFITLPDLMYMRFAGGVMCSFPGHMGHSPILGCCLGFTKSVGLRERDVAMTTHRSSR